MHSHLVILHELHYYFILVLKRSASARQDQQITFLKERMQEYKVAAVNAKKNNDIALAKQYLRIAKVGHLQRYQRRAKVGHLKNSN